MNNKTPTFALLGAAGYVAPRHMNAIKETGGRLVAALDPSDSVGVIDSYFPEAAFFTEFERFDRHIDKLRRAGNPVRYISVCSPNYLHDAHTRFALRSEADAICEKPLVLNPWNIDALAEYEQSSGRRINAILQLRLHPVITALKERIENGSGEKVHDVDLSYVTSRGAWYHMSWKGDEAKSGGIVTNIGVHFYDMLAFVFGPMTRTIVHQRAPDHAAGYLEYEKARVRWFLSINKADLPAETPAGQSTYRSIKVDGHELEFSGGFGDLHTLSYEQILKGNGFGLDQVRPSIEVVSQIRGAALEPQKGDQHPLLEAARKRAG